MNISLSLDDILFPGGDEPQVWLLPFNGGGVSPRERRALRRELWRGWLARLMECVPDVEYTPLGKPVVTGCPFAFSVSYTKGHIAFAAQDAKAIGVDIEDTTRRVDTEGVARRCFTEAERAQMRTREDFFVMWTAKEAILKALGTGFTTDPRACDLRVTGQRVDIVSAPQGVPENAAIQLHRNGYVQIAVCCFK